MKLADISAQGKQEMGLISPWKDLSTQKVPKSYNRNSRPIMFLKRSFQKERKREHSSFLPQAEKNCFYLFWHVCSSLLDFWNDVYEGWNDTIVAPDKPLKDELQTSWLFKSSGHPNWNFAWSTSISAGSVLLPCFLVPFLTPHCLLLRFGHISPQISPKKLHFPCIIRHSNCVFHPLLGSGTSMTFPHPQMLECCSSITVGVNSRSCPLSAERNGQKLRNFSLFPSVSEEKEEKGRDVLLNC